MKNKNILFLFIFMFSLILFSCKDNTVTVQSGNYEKVKHAVDSVRLALENSIGVPVPSFNLLIQTPNDYIFVSSTHQGTTPVTKDTYFRFASITKNFAAASILNMYEDGWLDINSLITANIPGSNIPFVPNTSEWNIPNKNSITIKQLLQHSAGVYDVLNDTVPGYGGVPYVVYKLNLDPTHQFTAAELVNQVAVNNLSYFLPGTDYHYSNTGYTILGEIVARIYTHRAGSTKRLCDYLNDYIVGGSSPVHVDITFPELASQIQMPSPSVPGTVVYQGNQTEILTDMNVSANVAEGNGIGTMAQLNTYVRSLMKGSSVLTPGTINLMKQETAPGHPAYGLGCSYVQNLGYGHSGAIEGYLSYMLYDPDHDVSIVIMTPFWDARQGLQSIITVMYALSDAGYAARTVLGLPGKP